MQGRNACRRSRPAGQPPHPPAPWHSCRAQHASLAPHTLQAALVAAPLRAQPPSPAWLLLLLPLVMPAVLLHLWMHSFPALQLCGGRWSMHEPGRLSWAQLLRCARRTPDQAAGFCLDQGYLLRTGGEAHGRGWRWGLRWSVMRRTIPGGLLCQRMRHGN